MAINMHAAVNKAIQTIKVNVPATYLKSTGHTVDPAGVITPTYADPTTPFGIDVQAATAGDLRHTDYANMEVVARKCWMFGNTTGIVRADLKGGDILLFPQVPAGTIQRWKVVSVAETWAEWCSFLVVLQDD